VPRDLFDIGASWAVFQRKYVPETQRDTHWRAIRAGERVRIINHMVAGRLLPGDVVRLLRRLDAGYAEGLVRQRGGAHLLRSASEPFRPFPTAARKSTVLSGRVWQRSRMRADAAKRVRAGEIVTLILLSPTALFHRVRFHPDGYWEQIGGLFGRSDRTDRLIAFHSFATRVARESRRVADQRLIMG